MNLRTRCHPEANGRQPQLGEEAWTVRLPLENGEELVVQMGRQGRDLLFGMLIADCMDSGEEEPEQFIPQGHYLVEDADGERFVKKPTASPHSACIDALLADMPQGRRCPKCDGQMIHSRLNGYQCLRGCQP